MTGHDRHCDLADSVVDGAVGRDAATGDELAALDRHLDGLLGDTAGRSASITAPPGPPARLPEENPDMMRDPDRWNGWWLVTATAATLMIAALITLSILLPEGGTDAPPTPRPADNAADTDDDGNLHDQTHYLMAVRDGNGWRQLLDFDGSGLVPVDGLQDGPLAESGQSREELQIGASPDGLWEVTLFSRGVQITEPTARGLDELLLQLVVESRDGDRIIDWTEAEGEQIVQVTWLPDGERLMWLTSDYGAGSSRILVGNVRTGQVVNHTPPFADVSGYTEVAVSSDGEWLAAIGVAPVGATVRIGRLIVVRLSDGFSRDLTGQTGLGGSVAWVPGRHQLAYLQVQEVAVFDALSGEQVDTIPALADGHRCVCKVIVPHPTLPQIAFQIADKYNAHGWPGHDGTCVYLATFGDNPQVIRHAFDSPAILEGWTDAGAGTLPDPHSFDGLRIHAVKGTEPVAVDRNGRIDYDIMRAPDTTRSPDGRFIVSLPEADAPAPILVMATEGHDMDEMVRQITVADTQILSATWTQDNRLVLVGMRHIERPRRATPSRAIELIRMDPDGTDRDVLLSVEYGLRASTPAISPDGRRVAVAVAMHSENGETINHDKVFVANVDGSGHVRMIERFNHASVAFTPDGTRVVAGDRGRLCVMDAQDGRVLAVHDTRAPGQGANNVYLCDLQVHPSGDLVVCSPVRMQFGQQHERLPELVVVPLDGGETLRIETVVPVTPVGWIP